MKAHIDAANALADSGPHRESEHTGARPPALHLLQNIQVYVLINFYNASTLAAGFATASSLSPTYGPYAGTEYHLQSWLRSQSEAQSQASLSGVLTNVLNLESITEALVDLAIDLNSDPNLHIEVTRYPVAVGPESGISGISLTNKVVITLFAATASVAGCACCVLCLCGAAAAGKRRPRKRDLKKTRVLRLRDGEIFL